MTPEELRREVRRLKSLYLVAHPEHLDLPDDLIHRAVAEHVLAGQRADVPDVFRRAFEGEAS